MKCLISIEEEVLTCALDASEGFEVLVKADFSDGFDKLCSVDTASVSSRTEFVIEYAGFPINWKSKSQSGIDFQLQKWSKFLF